MDHHHHDQRLGGALLGLGAAVCFGISAPLAKLLLRDAPPLMLAALLYLGAGVALLVGWIALGDRRKREAQLRRADVPVLAGLLFFGGALGPVLMLLGLSRVAGVTGALLLNLEAPFTIGIAVFALREHLGIRAAVAAGLVILGAALLGWRPEKLGGDWIGVALLAGASLSWAIDNNLTRLVADRDPFAVSTVKSLGAGLFNLALAFSFGQRLPATGAIGSGLALGAISYGLSYLLYMRAIRAHGAARQATYFATAPFVGALASLPLLHEALLPTQLAAMALMAAGVWTLFSERHSHAHVHAPLEHEHAHVHSDGHHDHVHPEGTPPGEPHSHWHRHEPTAHEHPHAPDLHHRHIHDG